MRKRINFAMRQKIYERDKGVCAYCGELTRMDAPKGHSLKTTLDHILPVYLGGGNSVNNLVVSCFLCNVKKGKRLKPLQFPKLTDCKQFQRQGEVESQAEIKKIMPSYKDTYQTKSDFLKVDDLQKKRVALTIANCEVKTIGEDNKLVLSFHETDKQFVLNVTNARMMEMLTDTDDYTAWIGTKIILRPDITSFNGKTTPCIRIDSELPEQALPVTQSRGEQLDSIPF